MDILSLNEPQQAPSRRLSRAEAIGLSMVVHGLLLLLFLRGVEGLPGPLARWVKAHAARPPAPEATAQVVPPPTPASPAEKERKKAEEEKKIPLRFAYIKVPDQAQQAPRDPRTFSDRDRAARQPVPTPPDAKQLTRSPHAEGDTREKVVPDPRIKKGKEQPEPPQPETDRIASEDVLGRDTPADGAGGKAAKPGPEGPAAAEEAPGRDGREGNDAPAPDTNGGRGQPAHPGRPGPRRTPYGGGQVGGGPAASRGPELRDSTEEKFHFENTGWMREPIDGDLSFDTKGLPWGDYARKIHVIIRQNWIDRLPLAFRQGQRGVTCQYFVIERDGTISSVDVVRDSHVPPFDRAASDALRASSALPPLPPEFNLEKEGVTYCFYYNVYRFEDD